MTVPAAPRQSARGQAQANAGGGFSPTRIIEVELTAALPRLDYDGHYGRAWILARLHTEPVGVCVLPLPAEGSPPESSRRCSGASSASRSAERFAAAGCRGLPLTEDGLPAGPGSWPFLRNRAGFWPTRRSSALSSAPATGPSR